MLVKISIPVKLSELDKIPSFIMHGDDALEGAAYISIPADEVKEGLIDDDIVRKKYNRPDFSSADIYIDV